MTHQAKLARAYIDTLYVMETTHTLWARRAYTRWYPQIPNIVFREERDNEIPKYLSVVLYSILVLFHLNDNMCYLLVPIWKQPYTILLRNVYPISVIGKEKKKKKKSYS